MMTICSIIQVAMERFFNTAGPCRPEEHYTLPPERRIGGVREFIGKKLYFVVRAPRQTGKTTCFRTLAASLMTEGQYVAAHGSCETGEVAGSNVDAGVSAVVRGIEAGSVDLPRECRPPSSKKAKAFEPETRLEQYLATWSEQCSRPVVLFLDEIDALRDDTLTSVLRQLRSGYSQRPNHFPQSVALIGLRDVRDYRARIRPDAESLGTSSPFNIKVESITLRNFTAEEVDELYRQYTDETGQLFRPEAVTLAFELTRGQPWLVNAVARQVVEKLVPDRSLEIAAEHIDQAKEVLIERRDTHLDSLVARLREPRVQRVIEPIVAGELLSPDSLQDDIAFVQDLGLVTSGPAGLEIANPIYREVIPRALSWVLQETLPVPRSPYIAPDGTLRFEQILGDFRTFWREHAEFMLERQPYSEAAAQLVLMAYLQRIVNGGGYIDREYAVGSGRIDLCIRWPVPGGEVQRWGLELKVWRDSRSDPLSRGLEQATSYLERLGLESGVLVIFDCRSDALPPGERESEETVEHAGRTIRVLRL